MNKIDAHLTARKWKNNYMLSDSRVSVSGQKQQIIARNLDNVLAINSMNSGFSNAYKIGLETLFVIATLKIKK